MNLKEFAKLGGCTVVKCGPQWGGPYGYKTVDHPNSTVCGYSTKEEALRGWVIDTFGEAAGSAVLQTLSVSNPETPASVMKTDAKTLREVYSLAKAIYDESFSSEANSRAMRIMRIMKSAYRNNNF